MESLFLGIALAFDLLILKVKFERHRYADFTLDLVLLIIIINIMHGTISGMIVGTIAQLIISIYLLLFPPKWTSNAKLPKHS